MTVLARLLDLPESRATLRDPNVEWLTDALTGGRQTTSGERVNPGSAMGLAAYFAAIRAISEDVGKLPLPLFERLANGGKRRLPDHPVFRLIHDEPNPEMSAQAFREVLTSHALGWGGGYAEVERRQDGFPVALWPLDPSTVTVERVKDTGRLEYVIRGPQRPETRLRAENVFAIHGLGYDGVTGYSVAMLAKQSIGLGLASEKSGAALFGNDARPGGVLQTPNVLDDEARKKLAAAWNAAYRGSDHAYKVAVLEAGLTFSPTAIPSKDAQWIESRQFTVEEIARWFRIPPHKLQHLLRSTFSNISHQAIEYVVDTLLSWLNRWESEIWRKLIPRSDQSRLFAEHIVEGLLRGDIVARFESYQKAIQTGWMNRNEARILENMNPEPGLEVFLEPLNMGGVGEDGNDDNDDSDANDGEPGPQGEPGADGENGRDGAKGERGDRVAIVLEHWIESQKPTMTAIYEKLLTYEADKATQADQRGKLEEWAEDFYETRAKAVVLRTAPRAQEFGGALWAALTGRKRPIGLRGIVGAEICEAAKEYVLRSREHIRLRRPSRLTNPARPAHSAEALLMQVGRAVIELSQRAVEPKSDDSSDTQAV